MANITQTLANTSGFIPQAWATEALDVLRNMIAVTKTVARDTNFEEAGWKGKSLTIPYPGTFSAIDKTPGSIATVQTPTGGSSVTLTLTSHKTVDFILEDVPFSEASSGVAMMQAYGQGAGVALAEQIETDLVTALSNGSLNVTGTAGTDLVKGPFFTARKLLNDAKAPASNRAFVMSTKDAASLLQDSTMQNYFAFNGNAQNDWQEGQIGRFAGFDVYESQFIAANAASNAIQTVAITGGVTGGTFTLTYGAQTTSALAWNATAATIGAALNVLTSLGAGFAAVTGTLVSGYTVYLVPNLVGTPTSITATATGLTGGTPVITVAQGVVNSRNLAYHKNALMVAFRQFQMPTTAGVEVAYATDPISGITLRVQMQIKPEYRGVYVAYDVLYGYTNLRSNQGVVVVS